MLELIQINPELRFAHENILMHITFCISMFFPPEISKTAECILTSTKMHYIIANLSLGLLISTMAQQQVIALMFSGLLLMMPTMLLSGMVFPIESMPWPLRGISCILPARWYITAVRKLMIQGLPMIYAWKEIVILASMAVVLIGASLKKLNNRLE